MIFKLKKIKDYNKKMKPCSQSINKFLRKFPLKIGWLEKVYK